MKLPALLLAAAILPAAAIAGPKPPAKPGPKPVYSATVSGMTCLQCKRFVKQSFSKLDGVDDSTFTFDTGRAAGTTVVSFASTSGSLTKGQAVKCLGDRAKQYVVTEFARKAERKKPATGGNSGA